MKILPVRMYGGGRIESVPPFFYFSPLSPLPSPAGLLFFPLFTEPSFLPVAGAALFGSLGDSALRGV